MLNFLMVAAVGLCLGQALTADPDSLPDDPRGKPGEELPQAPPQPGLRDWTRELSDEVQALLTEGLRDTNPKATQTKTMSASRVAIIQDFRGPPGEANPASATFILPMSTACTSGQTEFILAGGVNYVSSPNFPNNYDDNSNCTWTFNTVSGNTLKLSLISFDLEFHQTCDFDFLKFSNKDGSLIKKSCGDDVFSISSKSDQVTIQFKTDGSVVRKGFLLEIRSLADQKAVISCQGASYTNNQIQSPGWPLTYPNWQDCLWHIYAPAGKRPRLTVQEFQLENDQVCEFDAIEFDFGNHEKPLIYCGSGPGVGGKITSTGNYMRMRFRSDASVTGGKFRFSVSYV